MSRAYSGKTPIAVMTWRIAFFLTLVPYSFAVWVFYDHTLGRGDTSLAEKIVGLAWWWACVQLGGFLFVYKVNLAMQLVFSFYFQRRGEYLMWLKEGGSPFWDSLPWPFNTDSPKVRMAISRPPDYDVCPRDGWPLGRKFGNQCRCCGLYYDKG